MALEGSIARRYARALLEIGVAGGNYEQLGAELASIAAVFGGSHDLRHALENPVFKLSQRKAVMAQLGERLGLSKTLRSFLALLADRRRIARLPDIARELSVLVDRQAGRVRARVTSARPVPDELALRLRGAIEKRLGKQVILEKREDPALLGGLVAQVGDLVYDGSVRTGLAEAHKQLLAE
jgi:F-type H+-transporting ATPase subunit delta